MTNSYLNIITFLLTTLFYYNALKPNLTLEIMNSEDEYKKYLSSNYLYLAVYFLLIILIQFIVNASIISSNCGGNIGDNIGYSGILTFIPWILIFGVVILILKMFPGFKTAFSDVIGYFYVSSSASKLLTTLLIDREVNDKIINDPNMTPEKKKIMETTADAIIKICGNNSILINQIVPDNFNAYWDILKPLMKEQYQNENPDTNKIKEELFNLVVSRDNVGEAMWYFYTGLLLTSLVQLKITTMGCVNNPKTMEANYQKFLEQEEKAKQEKEKAQQTYTITG
jgi:hypothetical protein